MKDAPNFAAWSLDNLSRFAAEAYQRMVAQEHAIEQLRLDLKDAMHLLRKQNKDLK